MKKFLLEFFDTDTLYYASSLSFFTIFSFFPILALVLWLSSSYISVADANYLIEHSMQFINPTSTNLFEQKFSGFAISANGLGGLGIVYLIVIFVLFFNDYENIVNKIHHAKKRSALSVLFVYLIALLILCISFSVLAFINLVITSSYLLNIAVYIFYYLFLVVILKISINKKTNTKALFFSGFLMYNILLITKAIYIYLMHLNTAYISLYGGFSTILFTLLWVYVFWIAYLYSIKIYHYVNTNKLEFVSKFLKI